MPLLDAATNTVGLNGDQITHYRYSLWPVSNVATGLLLSTSYIRMVPSDEQVKNSLFKNGEQETPETGPMCFSKLEVNGAGKSILISGLAWKTDAAVTSFSPLS